MLALERGPLSGYIDVMPLSHLKLFCINVDKNIAIHADRSNNVFLFSVDLSSNFSSGYIQAQGDLMSCPAMFGFNSGLKDLDLKLPSSSRICSISVPVAFLLRRLDELSCVDALEILDKYNVVANPLVSSKLISILQQCWQVPLSISPELLEDELLSILIECVLEKTDQSVARPIKRQDRHAAALGVLSLVSSIPNKPFEIQDLAHLLHQSRTSLFKGCKEKFGMSPVHVVRSVKMHQVRHALLDPEFCDRNNIKGVVDVAQYFGFSGRSHFARNYKNEFMETPRQTLRRSRN